MSWANELYAVYEKAAALTSERVALLPISHSTSKAHLEVTIDGGGNFLDANPITDDDDAVTVIPVTEDSGARSSGVFPHPFADKLIYIAGDYREFCDAKNDEEKKFDAYIKQLKDWRDSEFSHPSVNALYSYLYKGTLIKDLVRARVLKVGDDGKLTADKIKNNKQSDLFVRFIVSGNLSGDKTWKDKTLQEKFIAFNSSAQEEKSMCYAMGDVTYCTYKHPSKLLNSGDKGKLFSANDDEGFTFRGRFFNKTQAFSIGYGFSQKMHNGLKWLIERQGVRLGGLTLVVWDSELEKLPKICNDSRNLSSASDDDEFDEFDDFPETFESYREALKKSVFGTKNDRKPTQKTMMLALDEPNNGKGRVSVVMYTELATSEFLANIEKWHSETAWNRFDCKQRKNYIGSFALHMIAEYAYGTEQNGEISCKQEIKNETALRLVPCVAEGRKIPQDILRQLVSRASRRTAYKKSGIGFWISLAE